MAQMAGTCHKRRTARLMSHLLNLFIAAAHLLQVAGAVLLFVLPKRRACDSPLSSLSGKGCPCPEALARRLVRLRPRRRWRRTPGMQSGMPPPAFPAGWTSPS
jgi:hypothetical protein